MPYRTIATTPLPHDRRRRAQRRLWWIRARLPGFIMWQLYTRTFRGLPFDKDTPFGYDWLHELSTTTVFFGFLCCYGALWSWLPWILLAYMAVTVPTLRP